MSEPMSRRSFTSSRVIVVGFDRIEIGIRSGSTLSVHFFRTVTVSASERGWVIIEMHMRWKGVSGSAATRAAISSIGAAGQSTRMKLRSA